MEIEDEIQLWVSLTTCRRRQATASIGNRVREQGSQDQETQDLDRRAGARCRRRGAARRRGGGAGAQEKTVRSIRPQMFEVGEVLAALALEYGTKLGTELDPQAAASRRRN